MLAGEECPARTSNTFQCTMSRTVRRKCDCLGMQKMELSHRGGMNSCSACAVWEGGSGGVCIRLWPLVAQSTVLCGDVGCTLPRRLGRCSARQTSVPANSAWWTACAAARTSTSSGSLRQLSRNLTASSRQQGGGAAGACGGTLVPCTHAGMQNTGTQSACTHKCARPTASRQGVQACKHASAILHTARFAP